MGDSFREFFRLAPGGAATGLAFGLACTFWLRFMYRHLLAEARI